MTKQATAGAAKTSRSPASKKSAQPSTATSPRPRAVRLDATQREELIVRRAIEYFAMEGFSGSTRDLANSIGVTQSLLYRYFPSKDALVDRVFEEVYLSRMDPAWEAILVDRSLAIEDRLKRYYVLFAGAMTQRDWVRIFLFAGLRQASLSKRLLSTVRKRIFVPVASELRAVMGAGVPATAAEAEMDIELVWALHASIFYLGIRKWVYHMPVPDEIDTLVETLVDGFIFSFKSVVAKGGSNRAAARASAAGAARRVR